MEGYRFLIFFFESIFFFSFFQRQAFVGWILLREKQTPLCNFLHFRKNQDFGLKKFAGAMWITCRLRAKKKFQKNAICIFLSHPFGYMKKYNLRGNFTYFGS